LANAFFSHVSVSLDRCGLSPAPRCISIVLCNVLTPTRKALDFCACLSREITPTAKLVDPHFSDTLFRRPGWPSGQVKKDTMVIHCPPDTHEHSVPLLHSTGAYLTVTTESGEMAYEVVDRSPSPTCSSSKRASFPKSSSRKSMLVRFQRDRSAGGELGVPDPFMSRSVSSPALAKTSGTSSKARGTAGRFAVFRRNRKRPCPVNVGPVAFEPAESLQAGVATVVLQMPAAGNAPSALCLGSTLVCSKSVNYPPSADANSAKSKYRLPLRKLL